MKTWYILRRWSVKNNVVIAALLFTAFFFVPKISD